MAVEKNFIKWMSEQHNMEVRKADITVDLDDNFVSLAGDDGKDFFNILEDGNFSYRGFKEW